MGRNDHPSADYCCKFYLVSPILTRDYIKNGVIPLTYPEDATHIAITVLNHMDYLLSWNFRHLVKEKTRELVNQLNTQHKYKRISIITPAEL